MTHTKKSTAMHEAGHLFVALSTSLRKRVLTAKIYLDNESWSGLVAMEPEEIDGSSYGEVLDYAKAFAGPIAQAMFYPDSNPPEVREMIKRYDGSVLQAAQKIEDEKLGYSVGWWGDLKGWFITPPGAKDVLLKIEDELQRGFRSKEGSLALEHIAELIYDREILNRDDLLLIQTENFPRLNFPNSLLFG